ncbi:RluA family pseudouridine synthase [Fusobacterium gastrosuis]|uniref:RluA family pseudouridine synthase n=1 Tax=Fusobacterium gastrosuis TaxID=1755100 RepID=UPI00297A60F6|nr:RluA family pseudouridine synthase [Fusobacteriaceae bacterium]MDY5712574.1 RluA family pseudouridine synthase [Fusobacterium gastrosuis]
MENIKNFFEFVVNEEYNQVRLDKFISSQIDEATRSYIEKLIDENYVLLNSKVCNKNGKKIKVGDKILVNIPEDEDVDILPENIELKIVFENDDFILINKKYDMVVHPAYGNYTGTLVNALMYYTENLSSVNGKIRPGIVHRLDKDTSGLILVAKNNNSHAKLATMFGDKTIHKTYLCIVKGNFSSENLQGRIENLIGRDVKDRKKMAIVEKNGKIAISNYKVIQQVEGYSLVEVAIETGRTHQIRVHMKSINHPILGDTVYGSADKNVKRQMLHAYKLDFKNPIDNKEYNFTAPLFDDFIDIAKKLKFDIEDYKK